MSDREHDSDEHEADNLDIAAQVRETIARSQAALAAASEVFPDPSKSTAAEIEAAKVSDRAVAGASPPSYEADREAPYRAFDEVIAEGGSRESAVAAAVRQRFAEGKPKR